MAEDIKTMRSDSAGVLWIVATPIGNLEDWSPRAQRIVSEAKWIFSEDTRETRKLLSACELNFDGRIERWDAHIESAAESKSRTGETSAYDRVIRILQSGESIVFMSDAGTPGISDPGARLVEHVWKAGFRVCPVPGPSALTALASVGGNAGRTLVFRGFLPKSSKHWSEERKFLDGLREEAAIVWFESPHRIRDSLGELLDLAPERIRSLTIAKELTKKFEKVWSGEPTDVRKQVFAELDGVGEIGEWALLAIVSPRAEDNQERQISELVSYLVGELGLSSQEVSRKLGQIFGVQKRKIYEKSLEIGKNKKNI